MSEKSIEAVRRQLAGIENGKSDTERARRTAQLKKLPPASRVTTIMEAAGSAAPLRRAAALAIARVGGAGKEAALEALLLDGDHRTRWNAAGSFAIDRGLAKAAVPALAKLVRLELPRSREIGALRDALIALGAAGTPAALKVLVAIPPKAFRVPAFRADWIEALSQYRAPSVKKLLTPFAESKVMLERAPALIGLLRNGHHGALGELRAALDDEDFFAAGDAARIAHEALGTKFVFNPSQLATLKRWWDKSPADLKRRVAKLQATAM